MANSPENEALRLLIFEWYDAIDKMMAARLAPLVPRPVVEDIDKIENTVENLLAHDIAIRAYADYMFGKREPKHQQVIREQAAALVRYLNKLPYPAKPEK